MAKLYFYYSAMNAGKSTILLQSNYNYQERGMNTLIFTPSIDDRYQSGYVHSRIGLKSPAVTFDAKANLFDLTKSQHEKTPLSCVFVDEAHFLLKAQVYELTDIVDQLKIPVLTYGLRSDFRAEPFEGSLYLLVWADELNEVKTICYCGKKANHVARLDEKGNVLKSGAQIEIGGNDQYISLCRKHYKEKIKGIAH